MQPKLRRLLEPGDARFHWRTVEDIAERIARAHQIHPIEGVTFSGGEPIQQASDLLASMRLLKGARLEISLGMYSGYSERELDSGRFWTSCGVGHETRCQLWSDIKQHLDFGVLGRFVAARPCRLPLRTTANQALRLFSDRHSEDQFDSLEVEVHIEPQGLTQITGFPLSGLPA